MAGLTREDNRPEARHLPDRLCRYCHWPLRGAYSSAISEFDQFRSTLNKLRKIGFVLLLYN
jgi:hypothetical protein